MNSFAYFISILTLIALSSTVYGQKCQSFEKEARDKFNSLIQEIESGSKPEINSVDALIAQLDPQLKQDYIFMAKSRSLQEGSVDNPRIILKSRQSELIVTFTGHSGTRGSDKVEVMQWNAEEAKFDLLEIDFSRNSTARVTKNPTSCMECHGNPSQPVWDPYRFWSGQVPFHEDTISQNSVEAGWYKSYLEKMTKKEGRFQHLEPLMSPEQFDVQLGSGSVRLNSRNQGSNQFRSVDGVASNMSNQMLRQNACRIITELSEREDFDQIKYALAGGLKGCRNVDAFLPGPLTQNAQDYFQRHGIGTNESGFSIELLEQETRSRMNNSTVDKLSAQRWFFKDAGLSDEQITQEISNRQSVGFGFRNFENASQEVTSLRYLLLPMGIDVNRWSMAIDKMSFGHGQIFDSYSTQPAVRDLVTESCESLAQKSREALVAKISPDFSKDYICDFSRKDYALGENLSNIERLNEAVLETSVNNHFSECTYCHISSAGQTPVDNVPFIPFDDIKTLKTFLQQRPGLDKRIMERLLRHPNEPGQMPQGMTPLSKEALSDVKNWFDVIRSNN